MAKKKNTDEALALAAQAWGDPRVSDRVMDPGLAAAIADKFAPRLELLDQAVQIIGMANIDTPETRALSDKVNGTENACQLLPDGWVCSKEINHLGECLASRVG